MGLLKQYKVYIAYGNVMPIFMVKFGQLSTAFMSTVTDYTPMQ